MVNNRNVGKFRSRNAHGASVRMPVKDNQSRYAVLGRLLVVIFAIGLSVLAGFGVVALYRQVNNQKIETVVINGNLIFVSEDKIRATVGHFVSDRLVAVDLEELKIELETLPWVSKVAVLREWPNKLIIQVEEELAIARWGETQLLNQYGQIFLPESINAQLDLPLLTGPENSEQKVMQQYQQFNLLLYPLGVRMRDLSVNERGAWTLVLTNGVEVRLGRDEVLARLRRLVVFLESNQSDQLRNIETIDLRYSNGIAVSHKKIAEKNAKQHTEVVMAL